MDNLSTLFLRLYVGATTPPRDERGDIPGWVMIVVMSAVLVGAILTVARPMLSHMVRNALNSVGN
ncbi:MAG: hypothetical protein L0H93_15045 [Nocardioides sp.]|nr:hypothetical protein [Nocardioides sp.]